MPYTKKFDRTLYDRNWLYEKYVAEDRNAAQVASLLNCERSAVLDALRRYDIPVKDAAAAQRVAKYERGSDKSRPRGAFKETLHNRVWLQTRVDANHSASAIAREAGCSVQSASRAIKHLLDLDSAKRPPSKSPERLLDIRARAKTKELYPLAQPCIVCGEGGTRNHINADIYNNDPSNIEWLCMKHHLMVDKRTAVRAVKWFRENNPDLWLKFHAEVLDGVRENPEPDFGPLFLFNK